MTSAFTHIDVKTVTGILDWWSDEAPDHDDFAALVRLIQAATKLDLSEGVIPDLLTASKAIREHENGDFDAEDYIDVEGYPSTAAVFAAGDDYVDNCRALRQAILVAASEAKGG